MYLINDQDDIAQGFDFVNQSLHSALKLAAELGSGYQSSQVKQVDFLVFQFIGYIAIGNADGKAFRHGGLAHTRFTDQAGIVFLPAVEDLDHTFGFSFPSNDGIQLMLAGTGGQIGAVSGQILAFFCLTFFLPQLIPAFRRAAVLTCLRTGCRFFSTGEHFFQKRREGMGAAKIEGVIRITFTLVIILLIRGHHRQVCHFIGDLIQVIFRDAHLAH